MSGGEGNVWTCGAGQFANGRGDRDTTFAPRPASSLSNKIFTSVACGNMVSMGIAQGELYVWGKWEEEEDSTPREVKTGVVASRVWLHHEVPYGVILDEEGGVYAWGKSEDFLTGLGTELYVPLSSVQQLTGFDAAVVQVALGARHSVALTAAGSIYTWGTGQGIGVDPTNKITYHPTPAPVGLPDGERACDVAAGDGFSIFCTKSGQVYYVGEFAGTENWAPTKLGGAMEGIRCVSVCAADRHALILADDGSVFGVGENSNSELGLGGGDVDERKQPTKVGLSSIVQIRAYKSSSFAINNNGEVFCWGANTWGFLGMGHLQTVQTPTPVSAFANIPIGDVALGFNHSMFLISTADKISKKPSPSYGLISMEDRKYPGIPDTMMTIRNSAADAVAKGQLWAAGSIMGTGLEPSEEVMRWRPVPSLSGKEIVSVCTARRAGYAVASDGTMYVWGTGATGGGEDGKTYSAPTKMWDFDGMKVTSVLSSGQGDWAMALTVEGRLYGWGEGKNFRTGIATEAKVQYPQLLELPRPVKEFSASSTHGLCLTDDFAVYSWGKGKGLGNGGRSDTERGPKRIQGAETLGVCSVAVGDNFSLLLTYSGQVYSWGDGAHGKLGGGDEADRLAPTKIDGLGNDKDRVVQIVAGENFAMALTESGSAYSWGKGSDGSLGLGYTSAALSDHHSPTRVTLLPPISYLFASAEGSAFALSADGVLYAWGPPNLGIGSGRIVASPVRVSTLLHTRVLAVGGGDWQSLVCVGPKNSPSPIPHGLRKPWGPIPSIEASSSTTSPTSLSPSSSSPALSVRETSSNNISVAKKPATAPATVVTPVDPARFAAHQAFLFGGISRKNRFYPADPEIDNHAFLGRLDEVKEFLGKGRCWEPSSEEQADIIKLALAEVKCDENVIKSWIVYSINKKDFELQRVLIVTDKAHYRMKYDERKHKVIHIKRWAAMCVYQVLCGKFKDENSVVSSKMRSFIEKDPYENQCGVQIWTMNPNNWRPPTNVLPFQKVSVPYTTYRPFLGPNAKFEDSESVCAEICLALQASIHWYRNGSAPIEYLNEFAAEAPKRFDGAPVFPCKRVDSIRRVSSMGVLAAAHNKWFAKKEK